MSNPWEYMIWSFHYPELRLKVDKSQNGKYFLHPLAVQTLMQLSDTYAYYV